MKNEFLKNITEKLGTKGGRLVLIALCIVGVLLIAFGDFSSKKKDTKPAESSTLSEEEYNSRFISSLENNITSFITKIDGVGEATVLVTIESGVSYEYACEQKYSDDSTTNENAKSSYKRSGEESIIIIDGENGKQALVLKRNEPVVMGVVVV